MKGLARNTHPQSRLRRGVASGFRLTLGITFLSIIAPASVFSQSMGSSATYSDQWMDNPTMDTIRVRSSGVTQDYNNTYGHSYWVVIKLTSPAGRTATTTSYSSSSYARVETSLPLDFDDPGDYTTRTEHWMRCPYMYGAFPSTILNLIKNIVLHAYQRDSSGEYVPTCCSPCTITPRYVPLGGVNTPYIQCGSTYDPMDQDGNPCNDAVLCANLATAGRCVPNTGRQPPNC